MNFLEIIRFSIRGLSVNRMRSALTTLGIMIGVMSVIVLIAVGNGSSKAVQSSLDRLGTNSIQVRSGGGGFGGGYNFNWNYGNQGFKWISRWRFFISSTNYGGAKFNYWLHITFFDNR